MNNTRTACTMDCPDACGLALERAADGALRLRAGAHNPFTAGFTCAKIKGHLRRLSSPERIAQPLIKRAGRWRPIGWPDALDLCAEKIQALRGQPQAILHVHGDGAKGVLKEAPALFFALLGASRIKGSLCDAAGFIAGILDCGSRRNNDPRQLLKAAAIVNWGKDAARSSVHTAALLRRARRQGAHLVTVSPGGDGAGAAGDRRVCIRPGTDRFLAAALIRMLHDAGRIDERLLAHSHHPQRFLAEVSRHRLEDLLAACEVGPEDARALFACYAERRPTATLIGAGLQRYRFGGENVRFINALAFLSGNLGVPGGGSHFHTHSYGNLNLAWLRPPGTAPRRALAVAALGREILAAGDPPVRLLWVNGINVVNQAPGAAETVRAFEAVDFKVVVDAFMNDTALRADLVLPPTLMLEQEDVIGSYLHDYVQHVRPVATPPAGARDDWWIVREVARRLDPPVALPDHEQCLEMALDTELIDGDLAALRRKGCLPARRPEVAYAGLVFDHPDGRYRFPDTLHPEPPPPEGFPLRLLTLVRRGAIHSQILEADQHLPPVARVSPHCPALEQLDRKRPLRLVSPHGAMAVTLELEEGLHPAAVICRRGDWMKLGGGANRLIAAELTDIGKGAAYYQQYVRLENFQPAEAAGRAARRRPPAGGGK